MILSIHIPKTAGTTLRTYLRAVFGPRLLLDYHGLPELDHLENPEHREARRLLLASRADAIEREFDVIHGHFVPAKYDGLFAASRCLTFVRDPYQHAISNYRHAVRYAGDGPGIAYFREKGLGPLDYIESFKDHQTKYFSGRTIDEFELVGVTEYFSRSVALLQKIFDISVSWDGISHNVNPDRLAPTYEVSDVIRRAVDKHREQDVALYRKAREKLSKLARLHGL